MPLRSRETIDDNETRVQSYYTKKHSENDQKQLYSAENLTNLLTSWNRDTQPIKKSRRSVLSAGRCREQTYLSGSRSIQMFVSYVGRGSFGIVSRWQH